MYERVDNRYSYGYELAVRGTGFLRFAAQDGLIFGKDTAYIVYDSFSAASEFQVQ